MECAKAKRVKWPCKTHTSDADWRWHPPSAGELCFMYGLHRGQFENAVSEWMMDLSNVTDLNTAMPNALLPTTCAHDFVCIEYVHCEYLIDTSFNLISNFNETLPIILYSTYLVFVFSFLWMYRHTRELMFYYALHLNITCGNVAIDVFLTLVFLLFSPRQQLLEIFENRI